MNIPTTNLKRVIIIGAGFGGLKLAKHLLHQKIQVVLIDQNNYHTFQPLLYQVATAGLEPDSIAHAIRTIFKSKPNFHFRIAKVYEIDPNTKVIKSNIGDASFDYLVVATGSSTNYYGNENLERNAMGMKSITESLDLRSVILQNLEAALLTNDLKERERLMNFVIVGGGPTGVELAGAFGELKNHILPNDYPDLDIRRMNVHLVQSGDALLKGMSKKSQQVALQNLEDLGVTVWFNTLVLNYDGKFVDTNNKDLEANTLIWAAGVKGNTIKGLEKTDCVEKDRYLVNEFNQIIGYEDIFAAGDVACMVTDEAPQGHPMVAQAAIQQGKQLAINLTRKVLGKEMKPFQYKDKGSMATIGRNKAVVDIKNVHLKGWFAWIIWMFVHLVSLVGFRNKIIALVNWVVQYFSYNKSVRLIIRPFVKRESYYELEQEL